MCIPEAKPLDKETNSISSASSQSLYPLTGKNKPSTIAATRIKAKKLDEESKEIFEWGCITKRNSSNNTKTTPKIIISITSPFLIKKKCAVSKLALETMKLLCSLLYYNSTKKSINYRYFE